MNKIEDTPEQCLPEGDPAFLNRFAWVQRWSDRRASVDTARRALLIAGRNPDKRCHAARGLAYRTLSWQAKWRGDFEGALAHALKAEAAMTEAENPVARADIYSILGVVYYSRSRMDLANCAVERGLKIVGEKITEANSDTMIDLMTTRATIQRYNGENARAGISLSKAAELAKGRELARVKQEVARFLLGDHDPKGALTYAEESLELAISQDNRVILPYAHELVGGCHSRLGSHDAAIHHFTQGEQVAKEDADRRAECQILHERGLLEAGRGNLEDSLALYRRAVKLAGEIAYPLWQQALYLDLARVYEELGDLKKALEQHKLAWKIVEAERR